MQEAASCTKTAGAIDGEGAAHAIAVEQLKGGAQLVLSMRKLALVAIGASTRAFPVAAQLGLHVVCVEGGGACVVERICEGGRARYQNM